MTKDYYGTKRVTAWPAPRGFDRPGKFYAPVGSTNEERMGYAVKYVDGYISWSPKATFEAAYKPVDAMGFEGALAALKEGHKVARAEWHIENPGIYLMLDSGTIEWHGGNKQTFNPSGDLLARDWKIVDSESDAPQFRGGMVQGGE